MEFSMELKPMPEIPNIPDDLLSKPGVALLPPPPELIGRTQSMISDAIAHLSPETRGLLTVWVDTTAGVNAAYVHKVGSNTAIVGWAGKKWGEPLSAGIAARVEF